MNGLTERLSDVIRWQLAHPGEADDPDAPEVPIAGQRVWGLFLGINLSRTGNGFGPNPLSTGEIESYSRMAREPIRPFEFEMLRALDVAFLKASRDVAESVEQEPAPASSEAIMGAFRRAVFPPDRCRRRYLMRCFRGEIPADRPNPGGQPYEELVMLAGYATHSAISAAP